MILRSNLKGAEFRLLFVEGKFPGCLEINRVRENEARVLVDVAALQQLLDFGTRLFFHPAVDRNPPLLRICCEVDELQTGLITFLIELQEFGVESETFLAP